MKVTPIKKKFGKYAPGDVFTLPDKAAKIFIKANRLEQADNVAAEPVPGTYATRMLTAEPVVIVAPYGFKADGSPRARPGRPAAKTA
jgi:hypothetical protein